MTTQTLLDMTQEILSSMSSDEVNSIGDTTESMQVATIIKRKYFDIIGRSSLPEHNQLIQLTSSTDPSAPVLMYVPAEVNSIKWIKYFDTNIFDGASPNTFEHDVNTDIHPTGGSSATRTPGYQYVTILPIEQFIDMVNHFNPDDTNVDTFTFTDAANLFPGNFSFYYKNNVQPLYCTVIGNKYVIFDAFDNTQDDTLQTSKTMCFGQVAPAFQMVDSFIPRLDDKEFPLLLNEAKALAFYELKQVPHQKAEQEIKRQWSSVSKNKSVDNKPSYFNQLPDYGRGANTFRRGPYWYGKRD